MLTAYYARVEDDNDVTIAEITLVDAMGTGTDHYDGALEEITPNMPGWYRLDIPDACLTSGAASVGISLIDAAANDVAPVTIEIQLIDIDLMDAVRGGMTALPNAASDAAGGLPVSDAGGLDLDSKLAETNEVTAARMGALTDWINGGRLDLILDELTAQGDTNESKLDTIDSVVDAILVDTSVIGAAGAGLTEAGGTGDHLTAIPWNSDWDAEVQSEVEDGLQTYGLDHLISIAVTSHFQDEVHENSVIGHIVQDATGTGTAGGFNRAEHSLEVLGDNLAVVDTNVDAILVDTDTTIPTTLATIESKIDTIDTVVDAVLVDTNELQTDLADGGRLDLILDELTTQGDTNESKLDTIDGVVDAILVDTGTTLPSTLATIDGIVDAILVDTGTSIPALIAALNDLSAADVNSEVVDVIRTDTATELSSIPGASPNLHAMIQLIYMALRNKIDVTASAKEIHNDAGTVLATKTLSDDGTTYSETKMA
jgi:hypothetical protein